MPNAFTRAIAKSIHALERAYWWAFRPVTLGARLILVRDGQVLLVRHNYQYEQLWFIPGGGVKKGETFEQAARREAAEEIGAELGDCRLLGLYTNYYDFKNDHVAVFICTDFTLQPQTNQEIAESRFFPLDQLPELVAKGSRRRIEEYRSAPDQAHHGMW